MTATAPGAASGTVGARYARHWDSRAAAAGAGNRLSPHGGAQRAAFSGVPDVGFDLPGVESDGYAELRLGLAGGLGRRWDWSLDYTGGGAGVDEETVHTALQHWF